MKMKIKINSLAKLTIVLLAFIFVEKAYCQSYTVKVGETVTLNVPSVSLGYVDKAIWACSNPAISLRKLVGIFLVLIVNH